MIFDTGPPMKPDRTARAQDELVEELLQEALDGYEGLVPDETLAEIRASLGDLLYAHPDGQRLLRQLQTDPMLSGSGDVVRPDAAESESDGENPAKQASQHDAKLRTRKARS